MTSESSTSGCWWTCACASGSPPRSSRSGPRRQFWPGSTTPSSTLSGRSSMALGFGGVDSYGDVICALEADLAEAGVEGVSETKRVEIQGKVLDKAAAALDWLRKAPPTLPGTHEFLLPKLIEDYGWQRKILGLC